MLNEDIILIIKEGVTGQQDLQEKLKNRGHNLNQSSISRKLKQLGISKHQGVYKIVSLNNFNIETKISFAPPNIIVINTPPGHANVIAAQIDSQLIENPQHPEFIGTIAGDDSIFIAVDLSNEKIEDAMEKIRKIIDITI
jgi:transcriptional regulator of arginine metabolism